MKKLLKDNSENKLEFWPRCILTDEVKESGEFIIYLIPGKGNS